MPSPEKTGTFSSITTHKYREKIRIEEIADALEKRSGSEENALAMLAMTAFTLMTRRGICEMQNVAPDGKGIRLELIGFRGNETIPDTLH
ncbi:hypothetical protein QT339_26920 (plasmid) [Escherichia coli]|nr:hypothetical protein [Salmonella enterica]MDM4858841.1 hypothetical protein [Escherichia coli]